MGAALLVLVSVVASCSARPRPGPVSEGAGPRHPYPGGEWTRRDPAAAGFDPARLEELAADAERNGSNCLVVIRHGKLVAEWYWNGATPVAPQEALSITKSFSSTLVGIAQADGALDIDDAASEHIPEWVGTPAAEVTIDEILSNDSGRHWGPDDIPGLVAADDRTAYGIGLGQDAAPGEIWAYNNSAIQTLDAVLTEATGQEPAAYAEERIFEPLGMTRTDMTRDASGNTNMFFGMQSTCQDLARFGYLFLRQGNWAGTQVVPRRWVRAATGRPSQDINAAYGFLWWLNRRGPVTDESASLTREQAEAAPDDQWVPGAPETMYWARGLGGQIVQVDPGSDTVVVRLGSGTAYTEADTARVVTEALTRGA